MHRRHMKLILDGIKRRVGNEKQTWRIGINLLATTRTRQILDE
jgi:hypothetical protein